MRCYEIASANGIGSLVLNERDHLTPGSGEVLVQVCASSINYRDLMMIEDPVPRGVRYPTIPNSDAAGDVIAVGSGVTAVKVGDRVATCFFQRWDSGTITSDGMNSALGGALDGVLAEQVILGEKGVIRFPDHLSYTEAATLPCAALTAWHALVEFADVQPGETVLLLGTGGVSMFALQFACMLGARPIVISSNDGKLERARSMGAVGLINYQTTPEWQDKVVELTDGVGVDVVVEVGGAGTLERSVAATRVAGRIALIGVLAGGTMNPTMMMRKSIRL
ncbi:MAG: NAD(P)-dependent alcohol dehydrogenase, partial [Pseudomonadota bacterium]|nr:NAD(P)-dependent alcohol dehydrogenase [Pseudomonadota bacterium]